MLVSLSSIFGGSTPANRAMEFFAKSLVSWICFTNGNMSGASRALTSTLASKLRAFALAMPFSMRYSSCVSAFLKTSWLMACIEIFMGDSFLEPLVKQCTHHRSVWCAYE